MIKRIRSWLFPDCGNEAVLRKAEADAYDEAERLIAEYRQNLHRHNDEAMKQSARNMIPDTED